MRFTTGSLFALAFATVGALASNVLELTPDNFDEVIGQGKPGLVELYVRYSFILRGSSHVLRTQSGHMWT